MNPVPISGYSTSIEMEAKQTDAPLKTSRSSLVGEAETSQESGSPQWLWGPHSDAESREMVVKTGVDPLFLTTVERDGV